MPEPDFSPRMLKGFLRARVKVAFYEKAFPNHPLSHVADEEKLERAVKGLLRKQSGVTADQFAKAWDGHEISADTRVKLWRALGVSPTRHGIELIDWKDQREMQRHAA